ncbi:hypothetical protein [Flavobacterium suncheonense]|uniref:Uncharacterized protein n=1 Tax=Flavobacterium suncheonense GH29-5 = DSM 17707 TaxID=1121899 RepID=A0A0A2MMP2_9FLAO|nr:hypothetical protein [Flavobacterium suncheonense]KGO89555.1 hypothetical protein Q764_07230 [Flavobacterium suncheonense GH29-5 = DSM 17707]
MQSNAYTYDIENYGLGLVQANNICVRRNPDGSRTTYTSHAGECPYGGTPTTMGPALNCPEALNGWFSDAWGWVKRNAKYAGTIGVLVSEVMDIIDGSQCKTLAGQDNPNSAFCRTASVMRDYTLTDAENAQVVEWATNYFSPFYNQVLNELNAVFAQGVTLDQQLQIINRAISKMSLFKAYLTTNPNGFSVNANKEQFNGVTEFFDYVEKVVNDIVMEAEVLLTTESTKVNTTGMDFKPFVVPTMSAMAELYKVANGGIVPTTAVLTPTAAQMQVITSSTTLPNEPKAGSGSGAGLLILGGIVIGGVLIANSGKKAKTTKKGK